MCLLCAFISSSIEYHKNRKRTVLKVKYVGGLTFIERGTVTGKGPPLSRIYLPFFPIVVTGLSCSLFMFTQTKFTFHVITEGHVFEERSLPSLELNSVPLFFSKTVSGS